MNKVIASVLQVGIALAVLACLFFQIVVLPRPSPTRLGSLRSSRRSTGSC